MQDAPGTVAHALALAGLRDTAAALVEGWEQDDVLRLVASRVAEVASASVVALAARGPDPASLVVGIATGDGAGSLIGMSFPAAAVATVLITEGTENAMAWAAGAGSGLLVPVGPDGVFGTLALFRPPGADPFEESDIALVEPFAALEAVAIRHAEVRDDLGRLSVLEDHERIAMDLHDGVVQTLFAVGLSLEATAEGAVHTESREEIRARLLEAVATIDATIQNLRMYIEGLHPPQRPGAAPGASLATELVELADSFRHSTPAAITVEIDPRAATLLADGAADIVQAAREGLSNAVRHAAAESISLKLVALPDDVVLEVCDDGTGFDPDTVRPGRGLANLRSRAASLGGVFRLDAAPGEGTVVQIVVPA